MSLKINNVFDTEGPLSPSFEEFLQQERLTAMLKAESTWLQLFLLISVIDGISNVTWKDLTHRLWKMIAEMTSANFSSENNYVGAALKVTQDVTASRKSATKI